MKYLEILNFICQQFRRVKKKKKKIYQIHQLLKLNIKVFILVLSLKYSAEIVDGNEHFL